MFDDERAGLVQEPFVGGADKLLDLWTKDLPNAEQGFRLIFSDQPFPGFQHQLTWRRADLSGNIYHCEELDREGWLCPALFKYFESAPPELFAKCDALCVERLRACSPTDALDGCAPYSQATRLW